MSKRNCCFYLMLISALFTLSGCGRRANPLRHQPTVIVSAAKEEEITKSYKVVGQTVAVSKVDLLARVTGVLEKRTFRQGNFVRQGELLFRLQQNVYQAEVQLRRAKLEDAQADMINAEIDFKRQATLLAKKATSQRSYDNARAAKMMAAAKVLAAQAMLKEAKINLGYTTIKAPFDGLIGLANYSVGNVVGPNSQSLATLISLDPMLVEFYINEALILNAMQKGNIKRGRQDNNIIVKLQLSNGTTYGSVGQITFIDNRINPATGSVKLRASFPNHQHILLPGQYVEVILEATKKVRALLIPQAALQEDQRGDFVMLVTAQHKVKRRDITVGSQYGINVTVTAGLKPGEKIIVGGLQKVREGMSVKTVEQELDTKLGNTTVITPERERAAAEKADRKPLEQLKSMQKASKTTVK